MRRNLVYSGIAFLVPFTWLSCGYLTRFLLGAEKWDITALEIAASFGAVAAIVVFFSWALTRAPRMSSASKAAPAFSPTVIIVGAVLVIGASLGACWLAYSDSQVEIATAAAVKAAALAEARRVAALTPEQRTAEDEQHRKDTERAVKATAAEAQKQEETAKLAKLAKDAGDRRFLMARIAVVAVKKSMREPESLLIEELRVDDNATIICIEYRARNGFGGMNREHVVFQHGKASQSTEMWNAKCTKPLYDMAYAVQ